MPRPSPTAAARVSPGALNGAEVTSGRPPLTASAPARPGVTCGHRRSRPCGLGTTPEKCLGPGSGQQLALIPEAPVFPLLAYIQNEPVPLWPQFTYSWPLIKRQQQGVTSLQSEEGQGLPLGGGS